MKKVVMIGALSALLVTTSLIAGGKCGAGKCGGAMDSQVKEKKMSFAEKKEKCMNKILNVQKCMNNAQNPKEMKVCKKKLVKIVKKMHGKKGGMAGKCGAVNGVQQQKNHGGKCGGGKCGSAR